LALALPCRLYCNFNLQVYKKLSQDFLNLPKWQQQQVSKLGKGWS
jgi:hypothetical protein